MFSRSQKCMLFHQATHERNESPTMDRSRVPGGPRIPGRRSRFRAARRIGFVQSSATGVATRSVVDQRRRVRGAHRLRTLSPSQLAQDNCIPRSARRSPRIIRTGRRSGSSRAGGAPTLPPLRPSGLADCDSGSRVCRRADRRCRAHPSATPRTHGVSGLTPEN
jgi:hypothetical protein